MTNLAPMERLLTFKEIATLLESSPECVWLHLEGLSLPTSPDGHHWSLNDFRSFIELNETLFGPGNNEL